MRWSLASLGVNLSRLGMSSVRGSEYYRSDGVRITHDPYASGMAEKYGVPGKTDHEGFDPYRDSVGPGIYGGIVQRDFMKGRLEVVIGRQYQNHNPRPGPVYAGGGYAPSVKALDDVKVLAKLLQKFPDLANDITTGGASPLHMCGMSLRNQDAVTVLVEHGADIEALDTYGMTPLHRMASNNLAVGAKLLLLAGASPQNKGAIGMTPTEMARDSRAEDVYRVLNDPSLSTGKNNIRKLEVADAEFEAVNGSYEKKSHTSIPKGFERICVQQGWDSPTMWTKLNAEKYWYQHIDNESYIYYNESDQNWWIDGPDGLGVYIAHGPAHATPAHGWKSIKGDLKVPVVATYRHVSRVDER